MSVQLWSSEASENADADPAINWQEGQPPSSVNDSARAMMAAIAAWRDEIQWGRWSWGGVATGTGDAVGVTVTPTPTAYVAGLTIAFVAAAANTGAATLAVGALAAKALQRDGAPLSAGEIAAGQLVHAVYDGTAFQILASPDLSAFITAGSTETLTAKTIDGDSNSLANLGLATLKVEAGEAGKALRRSGTGAVVADVSLPAGAIVGTSDAQTLSSKTLSSPVLDGALSGTAFKDEDDLASDSATAAASQKSIKAYVTAQLAAAGAWTKVGSVLAATGSEIDVSGLAAGYAYCLEVTGLKPAVDAPLYLQLHDGTGFVAAAGSYAYASAGGSSGSTGFSSSSSPSATFIDVCRGLNVESTGAGYHGQIFLYKAAESGEVTYVHGAGAFLNSSGETQHTKSVGQRLTAQANARFKIYFNGTTLAGGNVQLTRLQLS